MKRIFSLLLLLLNIVMIHIDASPVSLIWQTNREKAWEEDWLMELLDGVDVNIIDDGKFKKYVNNSIIIISAWQKSSEYKAYFEKLHKMNYHFGIVLLSDERYIVSKDIYKHATFVFRNYWHTDFTRLKNVSIFPLGYKTGFWRDGNIAVKSASERSFTWSFAGQISGLAKNKPTREAMLAALKTFPNFHIHETSAWADPNALNAIDYRNLLLDSVFMPCPTGWVNLDSFRLYEALECGCIPIVERGSTDYFARYFGDHPFIVVDSWDKAPGLMKTLLDDPDLLEGRRIQCYEWWQSYKKMLNAHWINTIQNSFR